MNLTINLKIKKAFFKITAFITAALLSLQVFAQHEVEKSHGADGFANSDHAQETVAWYSQPWFWALAAAALILIVAYAIYGGKSGKAKMEVDSEEGTVHP